MLTHHDYEDPGKPHFRATMSGCFKTVVDFFPLVGALYRRSTFVSFFPSLAVASDGWKQARIVIGVGEHASAIGRVRARRIAGADALLHKRTAVLAPFPAAVVAIIFHGQTLLANGYAMRRNREGVLVLLVSGLALVEVDEREGALGFEISVKGKGIVRGIEKYPFEAPVRIVLFKLLEAHDQGDRVMTGGRSESRVEWWR